MKYLELNYTQKIIDLIFITFLKPSSDSQKFYTDCLTINLPFKSMIHLDYHHMKGCRVWKNRLSGFLSLERWKNTRWIKLQQYIQYFIVRKITYNEIKNMNSCPHFFQIISLRSEVLNLEVDLTVQSFVCSKLLLLGFCLLVIYLV